MENVGFDTEVSLRPEILGNLHECMEPLELVFGEEITHLFETDTFIDKVSDIRARLLKEGIRMPLLRMRDYNRLEPREFLVLSYQKVLYVGYVEHLDEQALDHILAMVEQCMREKYTEKAGAAGYSGLC